MARYEIETLGLVIGDSNVYASRLKKVRRYLAKTAESWTMGILTVTNEHRWLYSTHGPANSVRLLIVIARVKDKVYIQPSDTEAVYLLTEDRRKLFLDDQQ